MIYPTIPWLSTGNRRKLKFYDELLVKIIPSRYPGNRDRKIGSISGGKALKGSALAYSFMITLLEGFGTRAYVQTLESFGLSEVQGALRLSTIARASEEISIIVPGEEQTEILHQIDFWIVQAYTTGLAQAMLVLAAVCLFSAAIVYLGLRNTRISEEREAQE